MANEQTTPGQVNPTVNPQTPATPLPPNDDSVYQIPAVQEYLKTEAQLAAINKLKETQDKETFVVQDPALIAAENAIRASQAQQAAALKEQGILQVLQRDAEIEANTTAAAKPPVGSLADYYNQQDAAEVATAPVTATAQPSPNPPVNFFTGVPNDQPIDLYEHVDPGLDAAILAAQERFDGAPTETAVDVGPQDPIAALPVDDGTTVGIIAAGAVDAEDPMALAVAEAAAANETTVPTEQAVIDAEEDPFEAARLAAAQRTTDEQPIETDLNVGEEDPEVAAMLEQQQFINREILAQEAVPVEPGPGIGQVARDAGPSFGELPDDERASIAGDAAQAGRNNAQLQKTLQARQNRASQGDWRVRIHLAPGSNYLYNAPVGKAAGSNLPGPGILAPLTSTDGVIFPYTPTIETNYQAKYQTTDLTHSNYRGYFYQSSYVDTITVRGTFTAQDTKEAQYLLAVIHFFRSVTKMFYGQGQNVGSPPPLVFLSGLGQYQFNKHPCVVSNFTYSLPNDVDYIRADAFNNYGLNLENRRTLSSGPAGTGGGVLGFLANKLGANGLNIGGLNTARPAPGAVTSSISNTTNQNSTYVPTKMEISVQLLPIQTRAQVSQQFSLQGFADGNLLKGGFW